jgi:hypothetical protein
MSLASYLPPRKLIPSNGTATVAFDLDINANEVLNSVVLTTPSLQKGVVESDELLHYA